MKLQNVMVELGPTSQVMDLVVDESGLMVGIHGQMPWDGLHVAMEAGPSWCTIRVDTPAGIQALFFVPGDTFGGNLSPEGFVRWLASEAKQGGATVDSRACAIVA